MTELVHGSAEQATPDSQADETSAELHLDSPEEGADFNLDDDLENEVETKTVAVDPKLAQIAAHQRKVDNGEIKSPEDLSPAQRWMASELTFPDPAKAESPKELDPLLEDRIFKKFEAKQAAEKEKAEFDSLFASIKEVATKDQLTQLANEYKSYRQEGKRNDLKALTLSVRLTGIQLESSVKLPSIPTLGRTSSPKPRSISDLKPEEQVERYTQMVRERKM